MLFSFLVSVGSRRTLAARREVRCVARLIQVKCKAEGCLHACLMKRSHPTVHQIELRVSELSELFNSMDPTPFLHRDLGLRFAASPASISAIRAATVGLY